MRQRLILSLLGILCLAHCYSVVSSAQEVAPLFTCETNRPGKYLSIVGIEQGPDSPWTNVQYRFGAEGQPEMVYPEDSSQGAKLIFFSHEKRRNGVYHVSIRFVNRGLTYRLFSNAVGERGDGNAGIVVTDARGKVSSRISCIERPYMFPGYLQRTLACDLKNRHGKAACRETPFGR